MFSYRGVLSSPFFGGDNFEVIGPNLLEVGPYLSQLPQSLIQQAAYLVACQCTPDWHLRSGRAVACHSPSFADRFNHGGE
jgi:hypothetical protein